MTGNLSLRKDTKVKHALSFPVYLLLGIAVTASLFLLFNVTTQVYPKQVRQQTPLVLLGVRRGLVLQQQTDHQPRRKEEDWQYSLSFDNTFPTNRETARKLKGAKAAKPNAKKTRSPKSVKSSKKTASTLRPTTTKELEDPSVNNVVPLPITEQNELVTCVSVIDENFFSSADPTSLWLKFREIYPKRPFCLLRPLPQSSTLYLPEGFEEESITIYEKVTRGVEDVTDTSDW